MKQTKSKFWDKRLRNSLFIFVGFILIVFLLPYLFSSFQLFKIDFRTTGQIGDTIGGITGPFIAVAASILTFIAFWVQYKANEQQRHDIQIERFENKFYELLRLHKENVNEFFIGVGEDSVEKRKSFVSMFNEFRYVYYCCKSIYEKEKPNYYIKNKDLKDEELIRLAYIFFYCGVGHNSNVMSEAMNTDNQFDSELYVAVLAYLTKLQQKNADMPNFKDKDQNQITLNIKYGFLGGHQSRLGHYYRHLFQTVKFVVNQEDKILETEEVMDYLRTLRAQLSDHEQLMLYYNAISGFGETWIKNKTGKNYFTTYKMIHNIPIPLANFGIEPQIKFEKELEADKQLFEWLDHS